MLLEKRIPFGYIFKKVKRELPILILFLIVIFSLQKTFGFEYDLPIAVPAFLGTAITLVLAFKLNQSYDRWWEARKIWGAIVNDSRSLVVQLKCFVHPKSDLVKKIGYRQIAWCYSLSYSLRGLDSLKHIPSFISKNELDKLSSHSNKPLALIN